MHLTYHQVFLQKEDNLRDGCGTKRAKANNLAVEPHPSFFRRMIILILYSKQQGQTFDMKDSDFKDKVFRAVAMIPKGRVGTYAQVAELAGFPGAARAVGNALHLNTDSAVVPCHRVVCSDGTPGSGYAFGGPEKQKSRLKEEGVSFIGRDGHEKVDLAGCGIVIENHPLKPFLPSNGKVLFLGSFPPPKARWSMEFFYPNPQNDFWRIQGLIGSGDVNQFINEGEKGFDCGKIKAFCRERGLGFFDTASRVCRLKGNASDEFLVILQPADIRGMLEVMPLCRTIVTTGGKSSEEFLEIIGKEGLSGIKAPSVGGHTDITVFGRDIRWWRMPSTSRAYPMKLEEKARQYRKALSSPGP